MCFFVHRFATQVGSANAFVGAVAGHNISVVTNDTDVEARYGALAGWASVVMLCGHVNA